MLDSITFVAAFKINDNMENVVSWLNAKGYEIDLARVKVKISQMKTSKKTADKENYADLPEWAKVGGKRGRKSLTGQDRSAAIAKMVAEEIEARNERNRELARLKKEEEDKLAAEQAMGELLGENKEEETPIVSPAVENPITNNGKKNDKKNDKKGQLSAA